MRILIFLALLLFPFAAQGQAAPDLSANAIPYAAEMTLTHSTPQTCAPADTGTSPFNAPDWQSENCTGGDGWTYTFDALNMATCVPAIPDAIDTQLRWERDAQIRAGMAPVVFDYTGDCQCKGGGTTGC